ncbi:MAG: P-loop NTPase [Bacteroidales bacterium]
MTYKIAIASGKGGTGKTTVAVNLYHAIAREITNLVGITDCDVEEPNTAIFFPGKTIVENQIIYQQVPEINISKCTFCRKCLEYCEFNAIVVIPQTRFADINKDLCHSCGGCSVACQHDAIKEVPVEVGEIHYFDVGFGNGITRGLLKIGSTMQTRVIKEVKSKIFAKNEIMLYDAPPGTSCPVVETIADTDFVILVTEPTPFGLYDLKLMVELARDLGKDFGVIVNKSDIGTPEVYDYLEEERIELLGKIPFSKDYASSYARGQLFENTPSKIKSAYQSILDKVIKKIAKHDERNYSIER